MDETIRGYMEDSSTTQQYRSAANYHVHSDRATEGMSRNVTLRINSFCLQEDRKDLSRIWH